MSRYNRASRLVTVAVGILVLLFTVTFVWAGSPENYTLSPSQGVPGKTYGLAIQSNTQDLTKAEFKALGVGVTTSNKVCQAHACTATLTIASDVDTQQTYVLLSPTQGGESVLLPFSVVPQPGGIPPGIDPSVDVAWKVVSKKVESDNFGKRISKLYYAIEVFIGNNSGYDLQVAGIYFQLPSICPGKIDVDTKIPNKDNCSPIPTDPYRTVRASLEREQEIGARNTTVNIVKALGPMLTPGTAFFGSSTKALHHKSEYATWADIFSGPFEKGLELIMPDQTVRQLTALDNQTLRDSLVVSNNSTVPTLVFIDKRSLKAANSDAKSKDDPQEVMGRLGTLRLEGKCVQYLRRVSITSNAPKAVGAPTVTDTDVSLTASGQAQTLTIAGANLTGTTIYPKQADLTINSWTTDPTGKSVTLNLTAAKPGNYNLLITNSGGSTTVPITVKPASQ